MKVWAAASVGLLTSLGCSSRPIDIGDVPGGAPGTSERGGAGGRTVEAGAGTAGIPVSGGSASGGRNANGASGGGGGTPNESGGAGRTPANGAMGGASGGTPATNGAAGGTPAASGGFPGNSSASGGVAGMAGTSGGGGFGGGTGLLIENPVLDVVVGGQHACALRADHSVWCWGFESDLNGEWPSISQDEPARVNGITIVAQSLAGNFNDNCVVDLEGQSLCWGYDEQGKLGDSATTPKLVPTATLSFRVKQIALGEYHSCALGVVGDVSCWGINATGELGDGTREDRLVPAQVEGLSSPVQVSVGTEVSCAQLADDTVSCWGTNPQCIPKYNTRPQPVGIEHVKQLSAGYNHACALTSDETVSCWGTDDYGQVGSSDGAACTDEGRQTKRSPGRVPGISGAVQVSAGYYRTCAVLRSGKVWCWGLTQESVIEGQRESYPGPTEIPGIDSAVKISVGYFASCAVLATGEVACWGTFDQRDNLIEHPTLVVLP